MLNNNVPVNNNLLLRKNEISPKEVKQYKYESPYVKNNNQLLNNKPNNLINPASKIVVPSSNARPISSKVENNQKAAVMIQHNNNNVVSSIKKIAVPEKKIGNQVRVAENLIKNNNYNYNYNNVKSNNQQPNFLRPSSGNRVEPVKVGNRVIINKK